MSKGLSRAVTIDEEFVRADIGVAIQHGEDSILRNAKGEYMPICATSPHDLGVSSVGLELYFRFLKEMCILFLCMSLTSVPPLVFNYMGKQLSGTDKSTIFEDSTLANQDGIKLNTTDAFAASSSVDDQTKFAYMTVYFDVATCGLFLLLLHVFRIYNWRTEIHSQRRNLSPAQYAVQVSGLPRFMPKGSETELKQFFESRFGPIAECVFAREFNNSLALYKNLSAISKEIRKEHLRCQIRGKPTSDTLEKFKQRKLDAKDHLKKSLPNIEDYDNLPVNRAFVVFENAEDRRRCLQVYSRCQWFGCLTCCCSPSDNLSYPRDGEKYGLTVKKVPSPTNILWENLESTMCGRVVRGIISFICVVLLLAGSYAAIYSIQEAQSSQPTQQDCLKYASQTLEQIKSETSKDKIDCFCSNVDKITVCPNRSFSF